MKIWTDHGSEHSANLVMIGKFKSVESAEKAKAIIDELSEYVAKHDEERGANRYSEGIMEILTRSSFMTIGPSELEQFVYDIQTELKGDQVIVSTDEVEISAFLKLLIEKGARVEVYSAHDYPDARKEQASAG